MKIFQLLLLSLGLVSGFNHTTDQIRGIAWFGLETEHRDLMCTWTHGIEWNLKKIENLGFNVVRIPFSYDYVKRGDWHVMDNLFEEVKKTNLSLVLDYHRLQETHQSFKPYNELVTFDHFLSSWETILKRYEYHPQLVGVDIWNEYQGTNYVEWNNLARQIVSFIDSRFSHRLWVYWVQGTKWSGSIHDVFLDDMSCSDRIIYVVHKYWFSDTEPLEQNWDWSFGNHTSAKINVGEWGYISDNPKEIDWAVRFVKWLKVKGIHNSFFWTWSFNSGDTGGVLLPNCETVDCKKMYLLKNYWYQ
jgi:hypothetical protein